MDQKIDYVGTPFRVFVSLQKLKDYSTTSQQEVVLLDLL